MKDNVLLEHAEYVQSNLYVIRVLAETVDNKLGIFFAEKRLFCTDRDLLREHASKMQTLLCVLTDYVSEMERAQDDLVGMLHDTSERTA